MTTIYSTHVVEWIAQFDWVLSTLYIVRPRFYGRFCIHHCVYYTVCCVEVLRLWSAHYNTHTHTRLTALCPGLPGWAGTRKVKPIWILLKQETVSNSGISWDICKSAPCSRHITTPVPHHSVFYTPDAFSVAQPTASKHWSAHYNKYNKYLCDISSVYTKIYHITV